MAIKLKSGNGPVLRAPQRSDVKGTAEHYAVSVQTSGGTTTQEIQQDAELTVYTGATYYRGGKVMLEGLGNVEIQNLDPSVGAVGSDGVITRLSSGIMRLRIKTALVTLPLDIDLRDKTEAPDQPKEFIRTIENTLAEHLQQQVDNRLAAISGTPTMATNGLVFTTQNHSTQTYVRNPDLWCNQGTSVDLTCISPWNSEGGARQAGTLISPRHVLTVIHAGYDYNLGARVRFISQDGNNTVYERTVIGKKRHPEYSPFYPDLAVHTLDEDLPTNVTPCSLMPSDWQNYLVQNYYNRPPALGLDQEEKALIIDFNRRGSFLIPLDATRLIFHEFKILGDSGNPAFLIVNDELVLVTCWTYGGAGTGTPVSKQVSDLNQMIIDADTQAGVSGVADPGLPDAMVVEGAGAAGANGIYIRVGDENGFPRYGGITTSVQFTIINANVANDAWLIGVPQTFDWYFSDRFSATPDLETGWNGDEGDLPVPTVRRATWADIDASGIDRSTVPVLAGSQWPNASGHYQVKEADFSGFPNYAN